MRSARILSRSRLFPSRDRVRIRQAARDSAYGGWPWASPRLRGRLQRHLPGFPVDRGTSSRLPDLESIAGQKNSRSTERPPAGGRTFSRFRRVRGASRSNGNPQFADQSSISPECTGLEIDSSSDLPDPPCAGSTVDTAISCPEIDPASAPAPARTGPARRNQPAGTSPARRNRPAGRGTRPSAALPPTLPRSGGGCGDPSSGR